jgi:hypothetical protein
VHLGGTSLGRLESLRVAQSTLEFSQNGKGLPKNHKQMVDED